MPPCTVVESFSHRIHGTITGTMTSTLGLNTFQLERVLKDNPSENRIALLGRLKDKPGQAILLLSRQHFGAECVEQLLRELSSVETNFSNDIYAKYIALAPPERSPVVIDTIYPATEAHIQKHSQQERYLVTETPELYRRIVLPHIDSIPAKRIQWVYNILSKEAEAERLIFEDPDPETGFMIHPDLKWDQSQLQQLYCLVLCHRRDVRSIRDLGPQHLPLLRNIRDKAAEVVCQRFGVPRNQLRLFLHYQPSYYHLHVHITHVAWEGAGALVGKAHLLEEVIGNIEGFDSSYYQKCTLYYSLGATEELWQLLSSEAAQQPGTVQGAQPQQHS